MLPLSIFYGAVCFPELVVTLPRCLPKTHGWPVIKSFLLLPGNYYVEINSTLQFTYCKISPKDISGILKLSLKYFDLHSVDSNSKVCFFF